MKRVGLSTDVAVSPPCACVRVLGWAVELSGCSWRQWQTLPAWSSSCAKPGAPSAALAFSSIPIVLQAKLERSKYPHNAVAWAEIPIPGSLFQAMVERNQWNVALVLILVTEQMFPFRATGKMHQLRTSPSPSRQKVRGRTETGNLRGENPAPRLGCNFPSLYIQHLGPLVVFAEQKRSAGRRLLRASRERPERGACVGASRCARRYLASCLQLPVQRGTAYCWQMAHVIII